MTPQERLSSALGALAMLAALIVAVVMGLSVVPQSPSIRDSLSVVTLSPEERPKPPRRREVPPPPRIRSAPRNPPSPRNLRNQATAVVAPVRVPLVVPPLIVAAPVAGSGAASNTGASDHIGTGQGAGGQGDGTGGGGDGDGEGDYTAPVPRSGDLRMSDLPAGLITEGYTARLEASYQVYANGRVGACRIVGSSGNASLDAAACAAIERRFRYRPSLDDKGRPVQSTVIRRFTWTIDRTRIETGED